MASILLQPELWKDTDDDTPPFWWEAVEEDNRYWFYDNNPSEVFGGDLTDVDILDVDELPESLTFEWEVVTPFNLGDGNVAFYTIRNGVQTNVPIANEVGSGSITVAIASGTTSFSFGVKAYGSFNENRMYGGVVAIGAPCESINFNCDCDDTVSYETLAQLRARLMVRLGYAGQVNNPPPGMAALLSDFLQSSQRILYMKYTELRTERIFTWEVAEGDRLFDLNENDDECSKTLNALKLSWVGMEDATGCENGQWYPLISGIRPEFYTSINSPGFPSHYEIRQCIEIFPPASKAMRLRIKGHYELLPFTADAHQTTIDSELVFLWALATAKAHYGHPDANNIAAMANDYLGRLVGGKHGTKRYVPGTVQLPAAARPVMRDGYLP